MSEEPDGENQLVKREAEELEQMNLALEGEKLFIDYSDQVFRYTGERFIRDHPDRAEIAIKLLALGFKNEPIARKVHCDHRVIRELRYRCIKDIEKQKEELRAIIFPGVAMSADRAVELLPNVTSAKDAAITHGILRDSYMQLSGIPQVHVSVDHHIDIPAQLQSMLNEATEKMKQVYGRIVEPEQLTQGEAT